ncbi:uncharacterized protein LOC117171143 [Belonocnema kinseyi]|uniref:uncharacterized protein LOC117171143 n=1 Tax=Belonocnema kinseyi TaxID=2817044 RepID=UPI00143D786D|nr:uncharacterized protein LOC117171143 [Belonocnema kinseyi]
MDHSGPYTHPRVLTPADLDHAQLHWLLRVGGRLKHSVLDPDERHPYILPSTSPFTHLVVDRCHQRTLHEDTQLTLATLRRQFWFLRGRQVVESRIPRCVVCIRYRAVTVTQLMGNLPSNRVQRTRAFLHSGVDFAGPIRIRAAPGRRKRSYKGYIAVFVCTSTRAVHLETVSDYTSLSFLAAYRRFASRRGISFTPASDQGTNFVGADAELRALFAEASRTSQDIVDALAMDQTTWLFVVP